MILFLLLLPLIRGALDPDPAGYPVDFCGSSPDLDPYPAASCLGSGEIHVLYCQCVSVRRYTRWSRADTSLVLHYFNTDIISGNKKLPGKKEIMRFKEMHPSLNYSWDVVKTKVMNEKTKYQKKAELKMNSMII